MMTAEVTGGLLTVREVARLLRVSTRQVFKLSSMNRLPKPMKLARSTRWRADEMAEWVRAGCPALDETARKGAPRG